MANVNFRAKEDGKEKTGEIPPLLFPSHGPMRFVTSHSRFPLAFILDQVRKTTRLRRGQCTLRAEATFSLCELSCEK